MKRYLSPIALACVLLLQACGGRVPSTNTAQDIVKDYFNSYSKKYKDTPFAGHSVQQVQIIGMEEIQKHLAFGSALVTMENGPAIQINMNFLYKAPLGWRQQGWEMVSSSENSSLPAPQPLLPEQSPPLKKKGK